MTPSQSGYTILFWVHHVILSTVGCSVGYALHQQTPLMQFMSSRLSLLASDLRRLGTQGCFKIVSQLQRQRMQTAVDVGFCMVTTKLMPTDVISAQMPLLAHLC